MTITYDLICYCVPLLKLSFDFNSMNFNRFLYSKFIIKVNINITKGTRSKLFTQEFSLTIDFFVAIDLFASCRTLPAA